MLIVGDASILALLQGPEHFRCRNRRSSCGIESANHRGKVGSWSNDTFTRHCPPTRPVAATTSPRSTCTCSRPFTCNTLLRNLGSDSDKSHRKYFQGLCRDFLYCTHLSATVTFSYTYLLEIPSTLTTRTLREFTLSISRCPSRTSQICRPLRDSSTPSNSAPVFVPLRSSVLRLRPSLPVGHLSRTNMNSHSRKCADRGHIDALTQARLWLRAFLPLLPCWSRQRPFLPSNG
jgi:hypothetical protein